MAWQGDQTGISFSNETILRALLDLEKPAWAVEEQGRIGIATGGTAQQGNMEPKILGLAPALRMESLGDPGFRETYGTRYAYYTGAMANGIATEDLVIALGR
jgi:hypothetical protein